MQFTDFEDDDDRQLDYQVDRGRNQPAKVAPQHRRPETQASQRRQPLVFNGIHRRRRNRFAW